MAVTIPFPTTFSMACQGKTHHVLGTQSIPLRHGLCQRQRILCEGARRAAGGVCAAGLTEAQVHDDLATRPKKIASKKRG